VMGRNVNRKDSINITRNATDIINQMSHWRNIQQWMKYDNYLHGVESFLRRRQLLKNFPTFYGTRRFITMWKRALHWPLSSARWIQSMPSHSISLRFILILFPTYISVSLVVSFLLAFLPKPKMQSSSPSYVLHAVPISSSLNCSLEFYFPYYFS
jgi:hypothetical protein